MQRRSPWLAAALLTVTACAAGADDARQPERRSPEAVATTADPGGDPREHRNSGLATPAASQVRTERPRSLVLPSGARLAVDLATTDSAGQLTLPEDLNRASWWQGSSKLGDPYGAVVIAAHVDSFAEGIGPIAEILAARQGELLRVTGRRLVRRFEVVSTSFVPRTTLASHAPLLSVSGDRRLVLITCGGPYDAARGGYRDNVILVARALDAP